MILTFRIISEIEEMIKENLKGSLFCCDYGRVKGENYG